MASQLKEYKEISPSTIKAILNSFFGSNFGVRININDKVVKLTWDMVSSSQQCSKLMDMVPRPSGFIPSSGYIVKQLTKLAKRIINSKDDEIYLICKKWSAYQYSRKIQMASNGL